MINFLTRGSEFSLVPLNFGLAFSYHVARQLDLSVLMTCIDSFTRYSCLVNKKTKVFCLIFRIFSNLYKACPNLDFETKIVEIRWKMSKIYYFEVENFTSQILAILSIQSFKSFARHIAAIVHIISVSYYRDKHRLNSKLADQLLHIFVLYY